jgi:GT2 family glycosyltransferase
MYNIALKLNEKEIKYLEQQTVIKNNPFVSIIIVNHNGKHYLQDCFNSIEQLDYPKEKLEVILVDNASSDGSIEYVKGQFPSIRLLELDKNYGFCKPNNEAVKIAKGEYIALLNNDTVVSKNWLSELVKGALLSKEIVSCASKMLYSDRKDTINTAGGKITIIGGGFYRGYGDRDGDAYNHFEYTGFGCGAGILVKKDFFEKIGGFDEDYFASIEEHDLGWKAWLYGYKVLYVPTAVVYHRESGTFGNRRFCHPFKEYLVVRNRLYNLVKNLETKNMYRGFILSTIFDAYRVAKYSLHDELKCARSIINGYADFFSKLNKTLNKRQSIQKNRLRTDEELYKLGVIAKFNESIVEMRRKTAVSNGKNL